jgi:hypothetical protein
MSVLTDGQKAQQRAMGFYEDAVPEQAQDPVVERNRQMLLDRSNLGIRKYGKTLAGNPLSHKQWLQHALEEALDLANYLQAEIMKIEQEEAAKAARGTPACTHRRQHWNLFGTRATCMDCGVTLEPAEYGRGIVAVKAPQEASNGAGRT